MSDGLEALSREELIAEILATRRLLEGEVALPELEEAKEDELGVSGRNLANLFHGLRASGIEPSTLYASFDVDVDKLAASDTWLSWPAFNALLEHAMHQLGEEGMREVGAQALQSPTMNMLGMVGWALTDEESLFRWTVGLVFRDGGLFVRGMSARIVRLGDWHLQLRVDCHRSDLSRAMILTLAGWASQLPVLVGGSPAEVGIEVDGPHATLDIHLRPHRSPGRALRRLWRRARPELAAEELREVYGRLVEQNVILEEKLAALELSRQARLQLTARMRRVQRMEAIGRFAGSITHDFNNLLTVILTHTRFVADALEPGTEARRDAEVIVDTAQRAAALIAQLAEVGARERGELELLDLSDLVDASASMLTTLLGPGVELHLELSPDLPAVRAERSQLEQVLINLVMNARDAMEGKGRVEIETSSVLLDESFVKEHPGAEVGPHVLLKVSDNGAGISKEVQGRIFEPFFTTKAPGRGTGLGLATVYGIVAARQGTVWVDSTIGKGTTFRVYLPALGATVEESGPERPSPQVAPSASPDAETDSDRSPTTPTVLFIEDDDLIRRATGRILTNAGFEVVTASRGEEALERVRAGARPDVILSDVIMPGVRGLDLLAALRADLGPVPVLFISGYARQEIDPAHLPEGVAFLSKPFDPDELLFTLKELIG